MSEPWLMALHVAAMSAAACVSSSTTDSSVSAMFVPVSPSGTGYTLSRLILARWSAASAAAYPAMTARRSSAERASRVGIGPGA